jgi:hypothetical protein
MRSLLATVVFEDEIERGEEGRTVGAITIVDGAGTS